MAMITGILFSLALCLTVFERSSERFSRNRQRKNELRRRPGEGFGGVRLTESEKPQKLGSVQLCESGFRRHMGHLIVHDIGKMAEDLNCA